MITPREASVNEMCVCIDTLGRLELETVAACIVLYHWEHSPDEWIPITRRQIADWIPTSTLLARALTNPFWKIDLAGFCDGGFIEGWDVKGPEGADMPGTLTQKFFDALNKRAVPVKINFTDAVVHRDPPTEVEGLVTDVNTKDPKIVGFVQTIDFENMGGPEVPCDAEK